MVKLHTVKVAITMVINADLYHANLIVNYNCLCNRFTLSCIIMLFEINKLNLIGVPVNIDLLLFRNETLSCDIKLFHIFGCAKIH